MSGHDFRDMEFVKAYPVDTLQMYFSASLKN